MLKMSQIQKKRKSKPKRKTLKKIKNNNLLDILPQFDILKKDKLLVDLLSDLNQIRDINDPRVPMIIERHGGKEFLRQRIYRILNTYRNIDYSGQFKSIGVQLDRLNYALLFTGVGIPLLALTVPISFLLRWFG